jgi:hypothetical protein
MDMKLEVVVIIPVSEVDTSERSYENLVIRLDID